VLRIEKFAQNHDCSNFDCGVEPLNIYLQRYASQNQRAGAAQTYVALVDDVLAGYYALAVGEIAHQDAPDRMKKGLARHPVPVMVLARLAVDVKWQGKGIGAGLLTDAARNTVAASKIAGIRALVIHAKDDNARRFYEKSGFQSGFPNPMHLYALVKELIF
jgi:GNAT superfamily N-acetyltransferase